MQPLANTLTHFKPPVLSDDRKREIEEYMRAEKAQKHAERVKLTRIPSEYLAADISTCTPEVESYANNFRDHTKRGLILRGDVGRGKTYAACAILNALLDDYLVRFTTMGDMLSEIRSTYSSYDNEIEVIGRYANIRVLMIDDFGKESPTDWALSMMFRIIDERYRRGRPTIYTTQSNSLQLAEHLSKNGGIETAKAIVSRMQQCYSMILEGVDRRTQR